MTRPRAKSAPPEVPPAVMAAAEILARYRMARERAARARPTDPDYGEAKDEAFSSLLDLHQAVLALPERMLIDPYTGTRVVVDALGDLYLRSQPEKFATRIKSGNIAQDHRRTRRFT